MPNTRLLGLLAAALTIVPAAPALAGPTVTVRVEGRDATLLASTTVTLPDVKAAGNPCSGAGATRTFGAAIEEATRGNWDRGQGMEFTETILGELHDFSRNDYWAIWLNENYGNGLCSDVDLLDDGDRVLALVDISNPDFTPSVYPMKLAAPLTAAPGAPFTVTATEFRETDGTPGPSTPGPATGATVTGGVVNATTDADGRATVRLDERGPRTLRAAKPNGSRTEPVSVCVTDGADGFCGTTVPGQPGPPPGSVAPEPAPARPADAIASFGAITAVQEGRRYTRANAPRELEGRVDPDPDGLRDVRLRLSRTDGERCTRFDGAAERFVTTTKCGIKNARTFSVGADATWDYLLPSGLPRGRYVLDVIVRDGAGNQTTTYQRGRNRVVFFVG